MNSQCCGSWMCWRILGSRALCNCLRFKKSERREIFCETFLLCVGGLVVFLWWGLFGCLDFLLVWILLVCFSPPSDDLFWSHSAVDELSIGLVSEDNSILVCPNYCWKLPHEEVSVHLWALSSCSLWCSLYAHGHLYMPLAGPSWVQNSFQKISSKSLWLATGGSLLCCFCGNRGIGVGEGNLWQLWRALSGRRGCWSQGRNSCRLSPGGTRWL